MRNAPPAPMVWSGHFRRAWGASAPLPWMVWSVPLRPPMWACLEVLQLLLILLRISLVQLLCGVHFGRVESMLAVGVQVICAESMSAVQSLCVWSSGELCGVCGVHIDCADSTMATRSPRWLLRWLCGIHVGCLDSSSVVRIGADSMLAVRILHWR